MRGEQQVVVMETGEIVTRLTSTALMGRGVCVWLGRGGGNHQPISNHQSLLVERRQASVGMCRCRNE